MNVRHNHTPHQDPPLPEEAHLVSHAKSGSPEAFAKLYDAYVERVSRYIYFRVSEDCDMEDLVSQVFLKAWENLDRYKVGNAPFIAWLFTIARNLVIDHYRTRKNMLPLEQAIAHSPIRKFCPPSRNQPEPLHPLPHQLLCRNRKAL